MDRNPAYLHPWVLIPHAPSPYLDHSSCLCFSLAPLASCHCLSALLATQTLSFVFNPPPPSPPDLLSPSGSVSAYFQCNFSHSLNRSHSLWPPSRLQLAPQSTCQHSHSESEVLTVIAVFLSELPEMSTNTKLGLCSSAQLLCQAKCFPELWCNPVSQWNPSLHNISWKYSHFRSYCSLHFTMHLHCKHLSYEMIRGFKWYFVILIS